MVIRYFCPMEVNDALIDKLAMLSRLSFNDAEREEIKSDLEKMISFVSKLQELNSDGIDPLIHISGNVNAMREDEVAGMLSKEEALLNNPVDDKDFFKVPKVITKPN